MSHTNSKRERKKDRKKNTQAVLQYAGEVEDEEIISDGSASYNDTEFPIATPEKTDQPAVNLAVTEKTGSKIDGSTQQNVADPTVAQKADSQQAQPITKYNTDDGKKTSNPSRSKNQIARREKNNRTGIYNTQTQTNNKWRTSQANDSEKNKYTLELYQLTQP